MNGEGGETSKRDEISQQKVAFYRLFSFADGLDIVLMTVGTLGAIADGFTQPLMTLMMGRAIHSFATSDPSHVVHQVSKVSLMFLYLAAGSGLAAFIQSSSWRVTGARQANSIRSLYLKTILRQDIEFFDTETTAGEVIGRLSGDTILIEDAMGEKVGKFLQNMSTFVAGFTIAFLKGWRLVLVLLPTIPLVVMAGATMAMMMSKMSSHGQVAYAEAGAVVEETVGAIRTVASFTGEKHAIENYNKKLKVAYTSTVQQGLASGFAVGAVVVIVFSSYGLAIWYGSKLIIEEGYNGGTVVNVLLSLMVGGSSLGQASPCLSAFTAGQAAAYKMFETIKRKPKIDTYDTSGIVLEEIRGEIELKDVYFKYPSRPDVQIFGGFSLHIPSRTTAALVGQSGSGKSTVISLLERFYDPEAGEVLIDGVNLKKLNIRSIREKIGLVSQEPILFAGTIKENISYGKKDATNEEIRAAIELSNSARFINKLQRGLDTMVGEHGTQLSGGQKQRIAIARAILKNPRILLLDEATSALDAQSERIVQDALLNIMADRTTVVVAHRLTTIRNADVIAVVHQGKIVEQGTHVELIRDPNGAYSQLVRLQEGTNQAADAQKVDKICERENTQKRSRTRSLSYKSVSMDSSSSHHSYSLSFGLPVPIGMDEIEVGREETTQQGEAENEKSPKVPLRRLAYLNKPEVPVLLLGTIAAAVHGLVFPMFAFLLSTAVKIFYEPPNQLQKIPSGKLIERIRSLSFEKVVHQEITWFDHPGNSSGAVGARLSTDASTVRGLVGDALALLVQNLTTIIVGLIISFTANWILALIILGVMPLLGFEGFVQGKFLKGFSAEAKVMYEEASHIVNEALGSIRTVASFCAEEKVMEMYEQKCEATVKQGIRIGLVSGIGFGSSALALHCTNALVFYIGAILVEHGKATFPQLFKVFFALTISAVGLSHASAMAPETTKAKDSAASIFHLLDSKPKIDSSIKEGTTLSTVKGDIELQHVSFKYPTRPDVQIFRDLCFSIPSGKAVALVGESGSGKSTVISLIERFYNPDSGAILLDGMEIHKFKLSWLRQQMGLVGQEPILFNETIRANIAYVGERGMQLSGGQKQRIAIARAIIKDPKILLLDEATSALDAESERVVQEALDRVMVHRTTVVVAHCLTTIRGADMIAVVKNGVIAEMGRHDKLMKIADGAYASMVALHMSSSKGEEQE
ncbi:ABC transporter B family member 9 [Vitis vinifera]|uniref:ABC transporter B family member 9 n=1 Tax=Vitis vinifera TaxID=29760 RepID=A0A438EI78_VITVI|nr:ABC transporter B family member 9 [Vitis vinifera]